jgi:hypothetical protein
VNRVTSAQPEGTHRAVSTGPIPPGITRDLERLKRHLADMNADDLSPEQTQTMAVEISAIRLQLKRLGLDQQAMLARLEELRGLSTSEASAD